jgi:hypothetical protein
MPSEDFRTLYCDPGEDFGWCQGVGTTLISAGTEKMWYQADNIWAALHDPSDPSNDLNSEDFLRDGIDPAMATLPIKRIVCEDFRIYPWKAKELAFDRVRTARVIGAITFMCRVTGIPLVLQGANIKAAAQAAGAEELYYRPLRENRHQNDAIQHFVFFTNVELMGIKLPVPDDSVGPADDSTR